MSEKLIENTSQYRMDRPYRRVHRVGPRPSKKDRGESIIVFHDEYVCIDIETTGFSGRFDDIIDICVYHVKEGSVAGKVSTLVKPGKHIPRSIVALTGIDDHMVGDAPSPDAVLKEVRELIGDKTIVGHHVSFDINFLNRKLKKYGMRPIGNDYVDTERMGRMMFPRLPNRKLGTLTGYLGITGDSHRAESDVLRTARCYELMRMYQSGTDLQSGAKPLLDDDPGFFDSVTKDDRRAEERKKKREKKERKKKDGKPSILSRLLFILLLPFMSLRDPESFEQSMKVGTVFSLGLGFIFYIPAQIGLFGLRNGSGLSATFFGLLGIMAWGLGPLAALATLFTQRWEPFTVVFLIHFFMITALFATQSLALFLYGCNGVKKTSAACSLSGDI